MRKPCGGRLRANRFFLGTAPTRTGRRFMTAPDFAELSQAGRSAADSLVFVDSNVFLYAVDEADLEKQHAARHWRAELWKSRRGRVSFQVLGEFYVNAVRKRPAALAE